MIIVTVQLQTRALLCDRPQAQNHLAITWAARVMSQTLKRKATFLLMVALTVGAICMFTALLYSGNPQLDKSTLRFPLVISVGEAVSLKLNSTSHSDRFSTAAKIHSASHPGRFFTTVGKKHSSSHSDRFSTVAKIHSANASRTRHMFDEEISTVVSKMQVCLEATNMSDYFTAHNYYATAEENAQVALKWLRNVIPRFETPYDLPCWNTPLKATCEVSSGNRDEIHNAIVGSLGGIEYSYEDSRRGNRDTLDRVHWSGNPPSVSRSVVCLPKIFLLGYPKCGSTFLYCLIQTVLSLKLNVRESCQARKEPHWWISNVARLSVQPMTPGYFALYLLNFERGAKFVEKSRPAVTIDGSPNLMFQWPRYSENETMENYCLLPSLLPVVLPDSKYFVVMRNPISMMYSAFWWSCTRLPHSGNANQVKYSGPDIFHERISKKIKMFNRCKSRGKPLDKCVDALASNLYGQELPMCGRTRLEMGLYYFHARKWLSVIPRERIHFFTLEELATQDIKDTAKVILNHLELSTDDDDMHKFADINCHENPQHKIDYKNDPKLKMREGTRQILEEFFKPYNRLLADLLGDDKFLW